MTCFNLIGDGHKNLRDLIMCGKRARARIVVTLDDGREEIFSGKCQLSPNLSHSKTVIDVIENTGVFNSKMEADLESLEARSRLLSTLNHAVTKNHPPFQISPVSLSQPIFNSILPKFHITDTKLAQIQHPLKLPEPQIRELSPDSSPEIIVDKLTPENNFDLRGHVDDLDHSAGQSGDGHHSATPSRPRLGPKKNFLARQAALDATLNVLRLRAEKSKTDDDGQKPDDKKEIYQKSNNISLEMSDNELIENHIEASTP